MKHRSQIVLCKYFLLFSLMGISMLLVAYWMLSDNEMQICLFFGILGLLMLISSIVAMPWCYRFDPEGVSICYLFLPKERYLWKNIYAIEVTDDGTYSGLFGLFFRVFQISGTVEGEPRIYMNGHIFKSRRTKRLLEKYWDGTVTGYFMQGLRARREQKRTEKQKMINCPWVDEVAAAEREIRARARQCIKPFADQAAQLDLDLRTKYLYVTKDFEEQSNRPEEAYDYTVSIEIAKPGETDEGKVICIALELLHVYLTKTAYKGVEDQTALAELEEALTELFNDIQKNGIESYYE